MCACLCCLSVAPYVQVDVRADKKKIKKAVQGLYDIQTKKINTLIRSVIQGLRSGQLDFGAHGKDTEQHTGGAYSLDWTWRMV